LNSPAGVGACQRSCYPTRGQPILPPSSYSHALRESRKIHTAGASPVRRAGPFAPRAHQGATDTRFAQSVRNKFVGATYLGQRASLSADTRAKRAHQTTNPRIAWAEHRNAFSRAARSSRRQVARDRGSLALNDEHSPGAARTQHLGAPRVLGATLRPPRLQAPGRTSPLKNNDHRLLPAIARSASLASSTAEATARSTSSNSPDVKSGLICFVD
jgi:hypothetical protein